MMGKITGRTLPLLFLAALVLGFLPSPAFAAGEGDWMRDLMERLGEVRGQAERKIQAADQAVARADGIISLARKEKDPAAEEVAKRAKANALEARARYQRVLSRAGASLENTRRLRDLLSNDPKATRGAGVVYSEGEVNVLRGSGPGSKGTGPDSGLLRPGDEVRTGVGGSAELRLMSDGSRIDVGPGSSLRIVDEENISLDFGKVLFDIRKWLEGRARKFEVRTPAAVLAVRGTRFEVSSGPEGTVALSVLEGEVEFSGSRGEGSVLVPAGRKSVMAPGGLPSSPGEIDAASVERLFGE